MLYSDLWRITLVVTPFSGRLLRSLRQATLGPAAQWSPTNIAHAWRVIPVHVQVTDKCQLDKISFLLRLHFLVLLVNKVISKSFLWFTLQQVINPLVKIYFLVLVKITQLQNEGAEDLMVENLILEHRQNRLSPLISNNTRTSLRLIAKESDKQITGHIAKYH